MEAAAEEEEEGPAEAFHWEAEKFFQAILNLWRALQDIKQRTMSDAVQRAI